MHWQQQECQSYSYFLWRLHTYTKANHLHDNTCRHIHNSFDSFVSPRLPSLFFVTPISIFSLGWHHFCPKMSTIHRILHNIFFIHVLCHVCIYAIFVIFGYLFIGLIFVSYISCFPFLLLYLLMKFRLLTSTKRSFLGILCSYDSLHLSVI